MINEQPYFQTYTGIYLNPAFFSWVVFKMISDGVEGGGIRKV